MRKDKIIDLKLLEKTELEKDILFNVNHPFICSMDVLFQTQERLYFVMPFVRGGELYKILTNNGKLDEKYARFFTIQLISAIGYLHEELKVAHRDIKLENILVGEDGYISMIDFGLAKLNENNVALKTQCGTAMYKAPEIWLNRGHSFPVDWWALGVCLYSLIYGGFPFGGKSDDEL